MEADLPPTNPEMLQKILKDRLKDIECISGKPHSRPILILPIKWYKQLLFWLTSNGDMPPKEIDVSELLTNAGKLRLDIERKKDYEIVEEPILYLLTGIFTYKNPIIRKLSIHPFLGSSCVLLDPILLEFVTPQGNRAKTAGHDWPLNYLKRHLCIALRIVSSDYNFTSKELEVIPDDWTVGQYRDKYGTRIYLTPINKDNVFPDDNKILTKKADLTASLPRPPMVKPLMLDLKKTVDSAPSKKGNIVIPGAQGVLESRKYGSYSSLISKADLPNQNFVPKPVGLVNLGNTCYFNSALQSILHIKVLYEFVLSSRFDSSINKTNPKGSKGRFAMAFKDLVKMMSNDTSEPRTPKDFRNIFIQQFKSFANYEEHDAQEALCSIIDGLHEDLCYDFDDCGITPRTMNIRKRYPGTKPSPIETLFSGMFYSSIYCPECKHETTVYDPFTFLSLPVKQRYFGSENLVDCLKNFTESSKLDESNKWKCDNCGKLVCATTRMGIERCPNILIIHLKRFEFSLERTVKIETDVSFPNELDLHSFCEHDRGKAKLISVIYHSGSIYNGHYTASSLDPLTNTWYYYNDSFVSKVDGNKVHNQNAYLLIYQKEIAKL